MIRRKDIIEAAIEGLEEQIRQKRATINQLRAELRGVRATVSKPVQAPRTKPAKRKLSLARRAALLRNLMKARAARARKRA
jgi:cell division septum initiation protein DivIVA